MTTDPDQNDSRQSTGSDSLPLPFLMEAAELLEQIEWELGHLRQELAIEQIFRLVRKVRALRKAADSVGLQGIRWIAERLEEQLEVLYHPQVQLDSDLESLIWQSFEQLRQPLQGVLYGARIDEAQIRVQAKTLSVNEDADADSDYGTEADLFSELGPVLEELDDEGGVDTDPLLEAIYATSPSFPAEEAIVEATTAPPQVDVGSDGEDRSALPSLEELLAGVSDLDLIGPPLIPASSAWLQTAPLPPQPTVSPSPGPRTTVRVGVEILEALNRHMVELLTARQRRVFQQETVQESVSILREHLQNLRCQLRALQDRSDQVWEQISPCSDPPGLESYREMQLLIQTALDESLRLDEVGEAVDRQSWQLCLSEEQQNRFLSEAQDRLSEARLMPLVDLFRLFPGWLQHLSRTQDKLVTLRWRGDKIRVDKAIAEKLSDLLLYLLHRIVVHSIEPSEIRRQQGKAEQGQIEIRARQQGNRLILDITDDGRGIATELLHQRGMAPSRAIAQPMPSPLADSTIERPSQPGIPVTDLPGDDYGHGTGLAVAQSLLQSLGGDIQVDVQPQHGNRLSLRIPLSLPVVPLLLTRVRHQTYALLTSAVAQILLLRPDQIRVLRGQRAFLGRQVQREELIPIYRVQDLLQHGYPWPEREHGSVESDQQRPLIVFRQDEVRFALEVDQLIGEQKGAIKPLAPMLSSPTYVYGCSPLGDGRLALVIDGVELVRQTVGSSRPDRLRSVGT